MDRPNFPVELVCRILSFLDIPDLLNCEVLNNYFRSLFRGSSRLQFIVELGKYCMLSILHPEKFPPFSTRLKLIRERERKWRSPWEWEPLYELLPLPPLEKAFEFVGGYYASQHASSISLFQLPSTEPTTSNTPLRNWTHAMDSLRIVDFTMDPAQDLLVVVALAPPQCRAVYQLHLRSFATNQTHPESSLLTGILEFLPKLPEHYVPLQPEQGSMRIQIVGDLIAVLVKEVANRLSILHIWNWRHGSHCTCAMIRVAGIEDFTFLSDNSFLIVRSDGPAGCFECYTFENPISSSTVPLLTRSYDLPQLREGCLYTHLRISMNSNPSPECIPPERVYSPHPNERIHACSVNIFKLDDHHIHSFIFFLNIKMFLNVLASPTDVTGDVCPVAGFEALPSPTTTLASLANHVQIYRSSLAIPSDVQPISWEDWGPLNTRWFDQTGLADWQRALYGLKTIECVPELAVDNTTEQEPVPAVDSGISFDVTDETGVRESLQRHLRIRDYNPYSLLVEAADEDKLAHKPWSRWDRRIVMAPSTILSSSAGVFLNDVVSALPYSEVTSREKYNVTDVMMDDCRVLLLQRGTGGKLTGIHILTI